MEHIDTLKQALESIEKALEHTFKKPALLLEAFTHRSYLNEHPVENVRHNERLEFLGDAVLGLVISRFLFEKFPDKPEGELSPLRAKLIDAPACAGYIKALKLDLMLLMGKGERLNVGRGRRSLLSDLLEAVIGALYMDGGVKAVEKLMAGPLSKEIERLLSDPPKNYKAILQHYVQKELHTQPLYRLSEEKGQDHDKEFEMEVLADDRVLGRGAGPSKKAAESLAAKDAWKKIAAEERGA